MRKSRIQKVKKKT